MDINTAVTVAIVSAFVSLAGTGLQLYRWRSGEQPASLTDTSLRLVTGIRKEMEENDRRHKAEMEEIRLTLARVMAENKQLIEDNQMLRDKLHDFERVRDWAERLVHQVMALGGTPVKIKYIKGES